MWLLKQQQPNPRANYDWWPFTNKEFNYLLMTCPSTPSSPAELSKQVLGIQAQTHFTKCMWEEHCTENLCTASAIRLCNICRCSVSPVRVSESVQCVLTGRLCWRHVGYHDGLGVAQEGVSQDVCQFTLPVGRVTAVLVYAPDALL